jgi:hypothetical protein
MMRLNWSQIATTSLGSAISPSNQPLLTLIYRKRLMIAA